MQGTAYVDRGPITIPGYLLGQPSIIRNIRNADPDNLLEGTGIRLRHIKVYYLTDITTQTLTNYVRASTNLAIAYPDSLSG